MEIVLMFLYLYLGVWGWEFRQSTHFGGIVFKL
jgi:hypothetical protein